MQAEIQEKERADSLSVLVRTKEVHSDLGQHAVFEQAKALVQCLVDVDPSSMARQDDTAVAAREDTGGVSAKIDFDA